MPAPASIDWPTAAARPSTKTSSAAGTNSPDFAASLEALSPLGVLARGYSLTFRADDQSLVTQRQ